VGVAPAKSLGNKPGASGAPGGPPAAAAALPPPETQKRLRERAEEAYGFGGSERDYKYGLYKAALKYGDPAVIALYGEPANPSTGQLQQIREREAREQAQNKLAHNANNTFFSGKMLDDVSFIERQAAKDRTDALIEFQEAKRELDAAWADAVRAHEFAGEGFGEAAENEFLETEPTPQAEPGGGKKKKQKKKMKKGKK